MPTRRTVGSAIALLAPVAVALTVAPGAADANKSSEHWSVRSLVVSDRTGDPKWQAATRMAVATWNGVGANVQLSWKEGGIGCQFEGTTIPFCRDLLAPGFTGLATYEFSDGHINGAVVKVAADRPFTQAQRERTACHEIGHVLGLDHSRTADSCLTQGSSSTRPDAADGEDLRISYAHQD